MSNPRLEELLHLLSPEPGQRLWFGGASPLGCLRGVSPEQAAWKPSPSLHSIWELALHISYWKYAVRRNLDGSPAGGFPRSPSNWPQVPAPADQQAWKRDRALLKEEHDCLTAAAEALKPGHLDRMAPGSGTFRILDLLHGIVMHDAYHVGQIQLLKRWYFKKTSKEV
jgi:uncharacterized damage-inducible protein DinB